MKKAVLTAICLLLSYISGAQTFTLDECQRLARENHPAIVQLGLIEKSAKFTVSNARKNRLPQLTLTAQATYQSEVPSLPEEFDPFLELAHIDIEGLKKDQYGTSLQLEQVIWAGGLIKAQAAIAEAEGKALAQNWEVEMYAIREKVNQLYFGTLLVQERIGEADLLIGELQRHDRLVRAYEANGVAGRNDLDLMRVELLTARQQKSELVALHKAYRTMLGIMVGREMGEGAELEKPAAADPGPLTQSARPELAHFEAREHLLDAQHKGVNASVMPQIGAFVQGAYGYPGPDFFKSMAERRFIPYYVAGVRLQWKFGGFYTRRNQLSQIELKRTRIASQRDSFLYNMKLKGTQESIAIERMREVMRDDDEIITLRTAIRKRTEAGVANGTQSVSDLLGDIASENLARQNRLAHEIELLKNIYDLKYTTNN